MASTNLMAQSSVLLGNLQAPEIPEDFLPLKLAIEDGWPTTKKSKK
jgi:hypothetical protein